MSAMELCQGLGVDENTLTADEKAHLDREGYLRLDNILTVDQAATMRAACDKAFADFYIAQEGHPTEIGDLQNHDTCFDICVTHPRVLAAVAHVLQHDFVSLGVHSRPNPPGKGQQAFHVDWSGGAWVEGDYSVCNSIWPLTDFTALNGATRVIPGSHRWGKFPGEVIDDLEAPHPDEIQLIAPLGSIVIFNSHLFHGAVLNRSNDFRPNVTSYWTRRAARSADFGIGRLTDAAAARLGPAAGLFAERCEPPRP